MKNRTIREISENPKSIINSAIMAFKSYKKISVLVEGVSDKELLSSIFNNKIFFRECRGKKNVIKCYEFLKSINSKQIGIYFLIDTDFDSLLGRIKNDDLIIYAFYCNNEKKFYFNDIENFLIHGEGSLALEKLFFNLGPVIEYVDLLIVKDKLEKFSRILGSFRASDAKLKCYDYQHSILDGVNLFDFVNFTYTPEWDMDFKYEDLRDRLNLSSPRKNDIEELFSEAENFRKVCCKWELSHGHDLSKILKEFLINNTKGKLIKKETEDASDIELMLRISLEKEVFLQTNVGKKLSSLCNSIK
ncbi:DUF4435 domain-containing protein [Pasteurella multocida]|uniref:DUF4435 domain-containing protein n=1 Tax=Pasteurella multocida TaxID=747 RepID=UPI00397C82DC